MSGETEPIWDKLNSIDAKMDKVLESSQDFKTWRKAHMEMHKLQCGGNSKKIETLEIQVSHNSDRITRSLSWRQFLVSVITGLVAAGSIMASFGGCNCG